ncbi:MAG: hypothetical protein ACTSV2_15970 [Candidatus Thorarchaeota archaeon]
MSDYIVDKYRILFQIQIMIFLSVFIFIAVFQILEDPVDEFKIFMSYGLYAFVLMVISAIFGYLEKATISFKDGKWAKDNKVVSIDDYEKLADEHKKQFSKIYDDWDEASPCCCTMSIPLMLFMLFAMVPDEFEVQFIDPIFIILYLIIEFTFLGFVSYKIGFHSKGLKNKDFFQATTQDTYEYAKAISELQDVTAKASVEIRLMDEFTALFETNWIFYIEGLPESVHIELKMEETNWACGYLVGTISEGPKVEEVTELLPLEHFCPAIIRYSNCGDDTILVCKYDFESSECEWDLVDNSEILKLAKFLVAKLRELYSSHVWVANSC